LANIGCTAKSSAADRKIAATYTASVSAGRSACFRGFVDLAGLRGNVRRLRLGDERRTLFYPAARVEGLQSEYRNCPLVHRKDMGAAKMQKTLTFLVAGAALVLCASVSAQQQSPLPPPAPPFGTPITLAQAMKAAEAAADEAKKNNMSMAIAIVEPSGALVYFLRMDGTQYASAANAVDKARAAALYRRSTKTFFDRVNGGDLSPLSLPGAVASAGGIPIIAEGKFIGAIGSSGGNDDLISQAGANALK
jgi:uncharacterized protein GlcG (DUF336 family)